MQKKLIVRTTSSGNLVLAGDILAIQNSRRAYRLLRDNSSYSLENGIIIFDDENDFTKTLDRIKNIARIIDAEIEYSDEVNSAVQDYVQEEKNFIEFSQKALDIKNNHCDVDEFRAFKNSLEKNMPARTLFDLQLLSAYHLAFSQNACNFSVPGAGKTSVVYGAFAFLHNLPKDNVKHVDNLLIIGPLSSFGPWEQEYEACFGVKPRSKRLIGGISIDEKKQYLYDFDPADITLVSYASVHSLINELLHFLSAHRVMVVLDEAHKIKNTSGGITAESVLQLAARSKSRVVLTGTPAPNGYEDLANLFKFIWPTKNIVRFMPGQLRDMSKQKNDPRVGMLLDSLAPYFVRVRKSDLGIPPAINNPPILVKMHPGQRAIYDAIEEKYIRDIENNKDSQFKKALVKARLIRLMQVATNPELLKQPLADFAAEEGIDINAAGEDSAFIQKVLSYGSLETPAKFEEAERLISQIIVDGGKVVVWACFIKTIEAFSSFLSRKGIANKILYGATPVATDGMTPEDEDYELTREAIIKEFHNSNSSFKVIIANPFAVAESISLHKACHNAIYLERSFNCAHFLQSKDRIHRYGLPADVKTNYYYLVSDNSVDQVIDMRLNEKEARLLEIIESMPIPLFDNAMEDGGDEDIKAVIREYARRTQKV